MYNIGAFPGKFFPPHRGHLHSIIRAATQVKKLYVVVSDNMRIADDVCKENHLPPMPLSLRAKWLSIELQNFEHIEIVMLDETGIPPYPDGTVQWSKELVKIVPEKIDVIFGGELEYHDTYMKNFPNMEYIVHDYKRSRYPINATNIRFNYLQYWDYILGSAKGFFARKLLISGTESCAKTTLTKSVAKIFHTSWSEEWGRHYPDKYLGGNDKLLAPSDFFRISYEQRAIDENTLKSANKIAFFDTDAVVTQFYCKMYTGVYNPKIEQFITPNLYDVVVLLYPNVEWVPDGMRWQSDDEKRINLHKELEQMYIDRGFKIIVVKDATYLGRLEAIINISDKLLEDRMFMSKH